MKRQLGCFLVVFFCLLLFRAAGAEQGGLFLFRVRPLLLQADQQRENGAAYVGTGRNGKQKTARLSVGLEGRSLSGQTINLFDLLRDHGGSVRSACWRLRAENPGALVTRFRADKQGQSDRLSFSAAEGWNLWDLSAWMAQALLSGEEFSFTLSGAKKAGANGADLAFEDSWIWVSLWLDHPPQGLEPPRVTDSALLDVAFSALPQGHWALKCYQDVSGSLTMPLWPETGVPYYFGGHSEEKVLHRYFPQQESRYYKADRLYLCGFDCGSFLHWVEEKALCLPHDSLSTILRRRADFFPLSGLPLDTWMQFLLPGDLLVFNHGTLHAGMVLGSPRMFGLSAETAPELAPWLDVPLIIHCGEDPFCHDRFDAYIDRQDYRMDTSPPDGGVTVSLLLPSIKDAPHLREAPWGEKYGYFTVLSQPLTVFPLSDCEQLAWLCPVQAE